MRLFFVAVYTISSVVGAVLFVYMWRVTRADRITLAREPETEAEAARRMERLVASRNEIVAGLLAFSFCLYTIAGTLIAIRLFGILEWPWIPGLIAAPLLVVGNFLEMLIAWALVRIRRSMSETDA